MVNYKIDCDPDRWPEILPERKHKQSFRESRNCIGTVNINFEPGSSVKDFENNYTNIPMFLTEAKQFVDELTEHGSAVWYVGMAPFALGRLDKSGMALSTQRGNDFDEGIYDHTALTEFESLKLQIARDIERYGRIE